MNCLVDKIIEGKMHCFFISPHPDDAILSAGGLLSYLAGRINVMVITVFTRGSRKPYTRLAKNLLTVSGYSDAKKFFFERRKEDKQALKSLNIKTNHIDFIDAAWRKKNSIGKLAMIIGYAVPEFIHIYPTGYHLFSGCISSNDYELVEEIRGWLEKIVCHKNAIIFCPLGIGYHVDHIIIRNVCTDLFRRVVYWSDIPYYEDKLFRKKVDDNFIRNHNLLKYKWYKNLKIKAKLLLAYKTQQNVLLTNNSFLNLYEQFYWNNCFQKSFR